MINNNIKIFFSYSHKDEKLCKILRDYLKPLERNNMITNWYDRKIIPGSDWNSEILENLRNSSIVFFLLSHNFLASNYINQNEVKLALELHNSGRVIVVPILLSRCDFESTPFKNIQGLPTDLIAIEKWRIRSDAYMDVVEGIKKVIQRVKDRNEISLNEESKWQDIVKKYDQNIELLKMELQVKQKKLNNIGMDLHDDVNQSLAGVKMYISLLKKGGIETEQSQELFNNTIEYLDYAINGIRQVSRSLIEDISSNNFDLKIEILKLESLFNHNKEFKLTTEFYKIETILNPQLEMNIFRIVQETLNNIHKHSKATEASISIKVIGSRITIKFTDNGIGFTKKLKDGDKGIGLQNIGYRLKLYNGTVEIKSNINSGVSIYMEIPIETKEEREDFPH